ncbi:Mediator of RNA polymerase II transcription subunit 19 [Branchiostoma belcheri]|nr:Mediator of RNA polymerase II transcription subunit 19 [Branchiostoma belcheri]
MALQPNPVYQPEQILRDTLQAVSQRRKKRSSEFSEDDYQELNEALMRNAITEHGRHPYRYGIASVNFKGDTRGTGNAALRKLLLGQLQGQTRVSILFVQECPWRDPVKQLQLSETFCYIGVTNEAGIIWNTELFELKRLDSYKLIGDKYPNLIQHRARVCISEMSIKHQPTELTASSDIAKEEAPNVSNFIAISWHGPHKCSEAVKERIFLELLVFLKTQTVTNDGQKAQALVIGGDFNLRLDKAWDNIDRYPGLAIPTSYGLETIDYFIFTSDLINILHAQHLSLGDDVGSVYTTQDKDRAKAEACKTPSDQVIDHRPVFAVLDLGSPNPFSSPSVLRETTERRITRTDVPGCSTDGSDRSSLQSSTRKEARTDGEPPVTQNGQATHEDSAFYLLKDMPGIPRPGGPHHVSPGAQAAVDITGSVNLIQHHGLEHSFHKFCGKKVKEPLSNFLPNLPGFIDTPGLQDGSSLRSLIEKPPIVGKELYQLSGPQLQGFRLHPGPIPEQYRLLHQQPPAKKKHKNKKHKREHSKTSEDGGASSTAKETGEARPAKEAPDGAKGAAAAEEGETDEKEPTEAKGTHNVNIGVKDDGQVQEPSDKSLDTSASPSPGVTEKRKQAEDSNTGPRILSGMSQEEHLELVLVHAERTGASSSFPCQEEGCNYKARSEGALETHMRREHTEKKYECDKCDFKTAHQSGLKRHRTRKHPAN